MDTDCVIFLCTVCCTQSHCFHEFACSYADLYAEIWVGFRVWVGYALGLGLREGWVDMSPLNPGVIHNNKQDL